MSIEPALDSFRAPDEHGAEERAWGVIRSAYLARSPVASRRSRRRSLGLASAVAVLVGAVALSPAGATVGRLIGRALGVQHGAPGLSSLPAPGRLLVAGRGGTWTVAADGTTRRLGPWSDASWSPHERYLMVTEHGRIAAVNGHGTVQWALARGAVADPRWYPPTGYRVAYLSGSRLRVVAGDGSGDHLLAAGVAPVAPAWRPGHPYQLAFATAGGAIEVRDADTGRTIWAVAYGSSAVGHGGGIFRLGWSADGTRLLAISAEGIKLYGAAGRVLFSQVTGARMPFVDAAISPDGGALAVLTGGAAGGVMVDPLQASRPDARSVLAGAGLGQAIWSPDGRWLLVSWPIANQWVFVRIAGAPRIAAVSRIAQQFSTRARAVFPRIEGWSAT